MPRTGAAQAKAAQGRRRPSPAGPPVPCRSHFSARRATISGRRAPRVPSTCGVWAARAWARLPGQWGVRNGGDARNGRDAQSDGDPRNLHRMRRASHQRLHRHATPGWQQVASLGDSRLATRTAQLPFSSAHESPS